MPREKPTTPDWSQFQLRMPNDLRDALTEIGTSMPIQATPQKVAIRLLQHVLPDAKKILKINR